MKKQYITYENHIRQEKKMQALKNSGLEFIYSKSKSKALIGGLCIVVAVIPNGLGVIFYPVGLSLLADSGIDFFYYLKVLRKKLLITKWRIRKRWK